MLLAFSCQKQSDKEANIIKLSYSLDDIGESSLLHEKLGGYVVAKISSSEESLMDIRLFDNIPLNLINDKIQTPSEFIYSTSSYHDFYLYAPYKDNAVSQNESTMDIAVDEDQTGDIFKNDFCFGKVVNSQNKEDEVLVPMRHLLSLLTIKLNINKQIKLEDIQVFLKQVTASAVCDFENGELSLSKEKKDIKTKIVLDKDNNITNIKAQAILPSQKILKGSDFIMVKIADEEFYIKMDKAFEILQGKNTELTLSLDINTNKTSQVDIKIKDWEQVNIDFSNDPILPPTSDKITDIEGNEYPILKIGHRYWMASNLRVTKFNDGTELKYVDGIENWTNTEEYIYTQYESKAEDLVKEGYLYNRAIVESTKICPEGWHTPTGTDWDDLGASFGGEMSASFVWLGIAPYLKSTDGWVKEEYAGLNTSGFNGYPAGYIYYGRNPSNGLYEAEFLDRGKSASWWSCSGWARGNYFSRDLRWFEDDFSRLATHEGEGHCIRCVHNSIN